MLVVSYVAAILKDVTSEAEGPLAMDQHQKALQSSVTGPPGRGIKWEMLNPAKETQSP